MANVCNSCAKERGARIPKGHLPTWHVGECFICEKSVAVTEARDFGITRRLLEDDEGLRYCEVDGFVNPVHKMGGLICPKCRVVLGH